MVDVEFEGHLAMRANGSWTAPGAWLVGDVRLMARASVWYGAVLRSDDDWITIGQDSNVQDGCTVHADPGLPVEVGARVSVGHSAVLHGCTIADDVLVGMGAVVLNRAEVGPGSIVAAGSVVLEGSRIPPNSLVAGVPARVRRDTTDAERAQVTENARRYVTLMKRHAGLDS